MRNIEFAEKKDLKLRKKIDYTFYAYIFNIDFHLI